MLNISNNGIITVTKGDTFNTPLFINMGNELHPMRYILQSDDEVYVRIMEPNQPFDKAIVRKVYKKQDANDNGDILIRFESADTVDLFPGTYYYEIKLKTTRDEIKEIMTIVPKTKFIILE